MEALAAYGSDDEDNSVSTASNGNKQAGASNLKSKVQMPAGSAKPVFPVGGATGGRAYVPSERKRVMELFQMGLVCTLHWLLPRWR